MNPTEQERRAVQEHLRRLAEEMVARKRGLDDLEARIARINRRRFTDEPVTNFGRLS